MIYMTEHCDQADMEGIRKMEITSQRNQYYDTDVDCTLQLSVRGGYVLRFTFITIDILPPGGSTSGSNTGQCEHSLTFYNSHHKQLQLTPPLCGKNAPATFMSNSSQVALSFRTNHRTGGQHTGFHLVVERLKQTSGDRAGCSREQTSDQCSSSIKQQHIHNETCDHNNKSGRFIVPQNHQEPC